MTVTTELIKKLRAMTGAGMLDVKKTLDETGGDLEKAAALLRERGIAKASKKSDREAKEGLVGSYVHHNGKIAVLVEVNCETDFVARNESFQELAKNLAIHIAMANPSYVQREEVPAAEVEAEREALRAQAREEGKPEAIIEKMVEGRLGKFFAEQCLLEQPYIRDDKKTIGDLIKESIATIGENIQVGRFTRIAIGE
ncbi:MAG: translation elongation factor Ts [Trueperaceae bacterium]|nr:translation elongation factor Ts [Trueperaceae bacterium]